MIEVYFDGACWPNPNGVATWSFIIKEENIETMWQCGQYPGEKTTNNLAEYTGLGKALRWLIDQGKNGAEIRIFGDSKLVVEQIKENWRCNVEHLAKLRDRCLELLKQFPNWSMQWIPGEQNRDADSLAVSKWEEISGKPFPDLKKLKGKK